MTATSSSSSILARITARMPWILRIFDHVPPGQFGRYLLVGTWNTLFGYCSYAAFVALLDPRVRYGYIAAAALSSLVSITVSFLGYKWFVFKTKGNYLREWIRCFAVYSTGIVVGLIILPIVVQALRHGAGLGRSAPYIGGALLTCFGVLYNFMGHKKFSFRSS